MIYATILFILLAPLSAKVTAGNLLGRELVYGVKGNLSLSNMVGSDSESGVYHREFSTGFGGIVLWKLHPAFQTQIELSLSRSKWKRDYVQQPIGEVIQFTETASITYLSIPVIIKLPFDSRNTNSPTIYFGSTVRFALSAKLEGKFITPPGSQIKSDNYSRKIDNYRSIDGGLIGGLDFQINLGSKRMLFDLRYTKGFTSVFNDISTPVKLSDGNFPYADLITGKQFDLTNAAFTLSISILL